jgi:phenylpropionate dioxygenase-like ring-hydroxylating dioxygenase large terminal subunit
LSSLFSSSSSTETPTTAQSVVAQSAVAVAVAVALPNATNFPHTWVPLCSVYEMDGTKPNSVVFCGREYVVYQKEDTGTAGTAGTADGTQQTWCVMDAICPHRLAPLREGRIVPSTQQLQCSYHGWTFDASYNYNSKYSSNTEDLSSQPVLCTSIPQQQQQSEVDTTTSAVSAVSAVSSSSSSSQQQQQQQQQQQKSLLPSSCATSLQTYPCCVVHNVLWAWLWPTTTSTQNNSNHNDDALQYTHLPEYYLQHLPTMSTSSTTTTTTTTYTRIVPYSYDILIENILDISHVPFAHHSLQGTRSDADRIKPIITNITSLPSELLLSLLVPSNFTGSSSSSSNMTTTTSTMSISDNPPTQTQPELDKKGGFQFQFIDQTRQQTRQGTCTFKAPYMVRYHADFVNNNNDDEDDDPHHQLKNNETTTTIATTDKSDTRNTKPNAKAMMRPFQLTTLLIPVSVGYSKIIILSTITTPNKKQRHRRRTSHTTNHNSEEANKTTTTILTEHIHIENDTPIRDSSDTATVTSAERVHNKPVQPVRTKETMASFLFRTILPRLPIWILHTFSNRFMDSDLLLLHEQELNLVQRQQLQQQQQQMDDDSIDDAKFVLRQYYMPTKADRSVIAIRKWLSQYAPAIASMRRNQQQQQPLMSGIASTTMAPPPLQLPPPPYVDRKVLFDRYHQHTKDCKHCNTMLTVTLPKYKSYSYALLSLGILFFNRHVLFRLACIGSILSFRIYHAIDHALRYGEFDHSQNH